MLKENEVWYVPLKRFARGGEVPETIEEAQTLRIIWKDGASQEDFLIALERYKALNTSIARAS